MASTTANTRRHVTHCTRTAKLCWVEFERGTLTFLLTPKIQTDDIVMEWFDRTRLTNY